MRCPAKRCTAKHSPGSSLAPVFRSRPPSQQPTRANDQRAATKRAAPPIPSSPIPRTRSDPGCHPTPSPSTMLNAALPGTVVCLAATILLILVTVSVPVTKSFYYLSADLSGSAAGRTLAGELKLGTFGYCLQITGGKDTCTSATLGYSIGAPSPSSYRLWDRRLTDPQMPPRCLASRTTGSSRPSTSTASRPASSKA